MPHVLLARVAETSTSTGTGAFTLSGALTAHRTFASVLSTSDTTDYHIVAVDSSGNPTGEWEEGIGTYSATNTLTRTLVLASSNSGSAVNFSAGTKRVYMTPCGVRAMGNSWSLQSTQSPSSASQVVFQNLSPFFDYRLVMRLWGTAGQTVTLHVSNNNGGAYTGQSDFGTTFYYRMAGSLTTTGSSDSLQVAILDTSDAGYDQSVNVFSATDTRYRRLEGWLLSGAGLPDVMADCFVPNVNTIKLTATSGTLTGTVKLYRRCAG